MGVLVRYAFWEASRDRLRPCESIEDATTVYLIYILYLFSCLVLILIGVEVLSPESICLENKKWWWKEANVIVAHSVTVDSWLVQQNAFQIKHKVVKWPKITPTRPHFSDAEWELQDQLHALPSCPPWGDRLKKTSGEEQKSAWEEEVSHHFVMWFGRSKGAVKENMFGNIWKIWRAAVSTIRCLVFIKDWNSSKIWHHDSILSKSWFI